MLPKQCPYEKFVRKNVDEIPPWSQFHQPSRANMKYALVHKLLDSGKVELGKRGYEVL